MEEQQTATKPGLCVKTFGCQMNEYDSEKIVQLLSASHALVDNPHEAELVIVNSCSVREKGEQKLFSLLGELRDAKRERPQLVIGVSGCVAQQEGQAIVRRNSAVDFVVGTHNLSLIPALVENVRRGKGSQVAVDFREEWEELPEEFAAFPTASGRVPVRALIAIQRGCSKHCSFCVVPRTRGEEVSRAVSEIEREIRLKVAQGAREVVLLGQSVNSYGRELRPRVSFAELIRRVAGISGVQRIRFTSPHPQDVRRDFIELFATVPQLCKHIHLPLQSGSDRILEAMNRNYRRSRYLEIVAELREACPEIALSTDIIVGFPSETARDFAATLDVVRQVRFHSAFYFHYSRRPNTDAAARYTPADEVDPDTLQERLLELQRLQDEIGAEHNRAHLGRTVEVLVEGSSNNIRSLLRGRIPQNTLCEFEGSPAALGHIVAVRVEHASAHGLRGSVSL